MKKISIIYGSFTTRWYAVILDTDGSLEYVTDGATKIEVTIKLRTFIRDGKLPVAYAV